MNILGIHGHVKQQEDEVPSGFAFHDAAAVLLRDGVLVAAVEEERLNRLKHANTFPERAIAKVLAIGGISLDQVDRIALNRDETIYDQGQQAGWLNHTSGTSTAKQAVADAFDRAFGGVDVSDKLVFCPHHLAHAWSAWAPSGFDESLVLVVDGDGDRSSGMVLLAKDGRLSVLREYAIAQSLGNLYSTVIGVIGYGRFDEYKAMGLAPYGDPSVYEALFSSCYELLPDGDYAIAPRPAWTAALHSAGLLAAARRRGQPFTQQHKDAAAALQAAVQRIIMHVLSHYARTTRVRQLCIAGGVGHNCSINGAIVYSGLFDKVFVQPAAHDAGGAYGAAVHAAVECGETLRHRQWRHAYLGSDSGCGEPLRRQVERWREWVDIVCLPDAPAEVARLLADNHVIGWVQGRAEFGPRALGNRSILADPRPAANKNRINAMVKKREGYRPFAPAVLAERLHEYFDVPADIADFSFMLYVLKVRAEYREQLGAITHVDGTARVQTVGEGANPQFWRLIREFERRTGVAMVLNTSLNNNAEPIVDSPDDAIGCFLTTGLDALVVGNYLLRRKSPEQNDRAMQGLVPQLAGFRSLVKQRQRDRRTRDFANTFAVRSTRSHYFGHPDVQVSEPMYRVLEQIDGRRAFGELARSAGLIDSEIDNVCSEARRLWHERIVAFSPK